MKLLLDECIDEDLRHLLSDHETQTVRYAGFAGLKNGRLLDAAEQAGFEALITIDRGLRHQQRIAGRMIALLVVAAKSSKLQDIEPRVPAILQVLRTIQPGEIVVIS